MPPVFDWRFLTKAATKITFRKPINKNLIISGTAYLTSVIPFVLSLTMTDLSFMYSFTSLHFITAGITGGIMFKEKITKKKILGMILAALGVVFIGIGR